MGIQQPQVYNVYLYMYMGLLWGIYGFVTHINVSAQTQLIEGGHLKLEELDLYSELKLTAVLCT